VTEQPHIVVAGAGAIGCFVGGLLAAGGRRVTLLARPRIAAEIRGHGLTLTDFGGMAVAVAADAIDLAEQPSILRQADVVLVTVKAADTAEIAELIDRHLPVGKSVISLQNGLGNARLLKERLPGYDLRGGMVPFNVVPLGQGGFHRATSGDLVIEAGRDDLAGLLTVPGLAASESRDIEAVQWGKFLINLNNALNALSGLTLQEQLSDRGWRQLMARQWKEALRVLRSHGIRPQSTTPVSVGAIPMILKLPTPLFRRVAASMLTIDEQARTSMSLDLMAGRRTEIGALQEEVVRMGAESGVPTPINALVADLVRTAETAGEGLPNLPVASIFAELRRSRG
jgi:2-dehydropantoate 2-reductase